MSLIDYIPNIKRVASTRGGEYRGPCPWCGGKDRLIIHPSAAEKMGLYKCRQCNQSGNGITWLTRHYESKMSYNEAHEALGITPSTNYRQPSLKSSQNFEPEPEPDYPGLLWSKKAETICYHAHKYLLSGEGEAQRSILINRGIQTCSIKKFRLGFVPNSISYDSKSFGLDIKKDIWFPSGITIPYFVDNRLIRVRIRRDGENIKSRYVILLGSSSEMMLIR